MSKINSVSKNNFYTKPVAQPVTQPNVKQKSESSNKTKVAFGMGLVALASTGVYIASKGNGVNVEKVFETLKDAGSCMEILKSTKLAPKSFKELMFKITSDEKTGEKFIQEMISNPKNSKENVRVLSQKIGGDKELLDWMHKPKGYQEAYTNYVTKLYENPQTTPDDLIKISPNWTIWSLKNKFKSDFTIGELPKEFGGTDKYRQTFYSALDKHNCNIDGIGFGDYIGGGLSGKGVRKVFVGGKNYILKYQSMDSELNKMGNEFVINEVKDCLSMKSDSTFLNAQLDRYLELNGHQNGPKLKFFDYKTNSALYEVTEGVKPAEEEITDILKVNKRLGDLNALGVYYNDVNSSNFMVNEGKMSFIDSGEASFVDFFKPGVSGYHFSLPNWNGKSITDTASAISLAK